MIYKLRFNRSKYLVFEIMPAEIEEKLGDYFVLDEPVWSDFWKPLTSRFIDFSDEKNVIKPPDITCWFTEQLVLNEKAYRALSNDLSPYGEFLKTKCEGVTYWVLHVTKKTGIDVVDEIKSERVVNESGYKDIKKLIFKESLVGDFLLFKSAYDDYKNIYCNTRFKQMVELADLHGLVFNIDLASVF